VVGPAVAAAELASRHPDPLVAPGLEQHALEQLALGLLLLGALVQLTADPDQALGQVVAHPLELPEREHARAAQPARGAEVDALTRERPHEGGRELTLELV
jgi:hypothetical protein